MARTPLLFQLTPWTTTDDASLEDPVQVDSSHLSQEERLPRLHGDLCMYCGAAGHVLHDCRACPPKQQAPSPGASPTPGMVIKSLLLPVTLYCLDSPFVFRSPD